MQHALGDSSVDSLLLVKLPGFSPESKRLFMALHLLCKQGSHSKAIRKVKPRRRLLAAINRDRLQCERLSLIRSSHLSQNVCNVPGCVRKAHLVIHLPEDLSGRAIVTPCRLILHQVPLDPADCNVNLSPEFRITLRATGFQGVSEELSRVFEPTLLVGSSALFNERFRCPVRHEVSLAQALESASSGSLPLYPVPRLPSLP